MFDWPFLVLLGFLLYEITLGLIERYVRREALRRIEQRSTMLLPPASAEGSEEAAPVADTEYDDR